MINSFTVIDFETVIGHYICSIGIVKIVNEIAFDVYHALIIP